MSTSLSEGTLLALSDDDEGVAIQRGGEWWDSESQYRRHAHTMTQRAPLHPALSLETDRGFGDEHDEKNAPSRL